MEVVLAILIIILGLGSFILFMRALDDEILESRKDKDIDDEATRNQF